jgi:N-acetylmuramoyl-L-alanine amidase
VGKDHVVKQGEHLSQIAKKYGFDYKALWNHPSNATLKKLRVNPNVLMPGDVVHIPDIREKTESRAAGQTHKFKMGSKLMLRLALKDFGNEPVKNTKCQITIDGVTTQLQTDGSGHIEVPVSPAATTAQLTFPDPSTPFDLTVPIQIGHLDPVTELSGQRARLSNLGYITRPIADVDEVYFEHVVQEFQCDLGVPVTGKCDAATQSKLKELHGS